MLCLMMTLQMASQTTSEPIVKSVNLNGDTVITMFMSDARIIFKGLMGQTIGDSLLAKYAVNDSINKKTIAGQESVIKLLKSKNGDLNLIIDGKDNIIKNKDIEIALLEEDKVKLKDDVKKEKNLKNLFKGSTLLGIIIGIFGLLF